MLNDCILINNIFDRAINLLHRAFLFYIWKSKAIKHLNPADVIDITITIKDQYANHKHDQKIFKI